jgi:type I restriction enzyme, R subunit
MCRARPQYVPPPIDLTVFLRPEKSRILFEQMLGRGTRKGDSHLNKFHFVVFDCFGTLQAGHGYHS